VLLKESTILPFCNSGLDGVRRSCCAFMRVKKTMMPLFGAWLAFTAVARAEPKCFIDELTVEGVSRDGRYAMTSSTDHFGLVRVELIDLKDGETVLDGTVYENDFEAVDVADLLQVGRLSLRATADWAAWRGPWSKLRRRLQARCGPFELPKRVQDADVEPADAREIYVGTNYAAVTFDLGEADDCGSTTGQVVAAIACGKPRTTEKQEPDSRLILESGAPTELLATIATKIYCGRRDPLGAYRLVSRLARNVKTETFSPEVRLAIESDETLYLSQLGWLGRAQCQWLERTAEARLGAAWKSPPSPAAVRLKQATMFNMRKCHPPPAP